MCVSVGSTAIIIVKCLYPAVFSLTLIDFNILSSQYTDRVNPVEDHVNVLAAKYGISAAPITPQMFGGAGREHMEKYGE